MVHIFQFRHTFRADAENSAVELVGQNAQSRLLQWPRHQTAKTWPVLSQKKLYPVCASFVGQNVPKHYIHCTSLHKYWQIEELQEQGENKMTASIQAVNKLGQRYSSSAGHSTNLAHQKHSLSHTFTSGFQPTVYSTYFVFYSNVSFPSKIIILTSSIILIPTGLSRAKDLH